MSLDGFLVRQRPFEAHAEQAAAAAQRAAARARARFPPYRSARTHDNTDTHAHAAAPSSSAALPPAKRTRFDAPPSSSSSSSHASFSSSSSSSSSFPPSSSSSSSLAPADARDAPSLSARQVRIEDLSKVTRVESVSELKGALDRALCACAWSRALSALRRLELLFINKSMLADTMVGKTVNSIKGQLAKKKRAAEAAAAAAAASSSSSAAAAASSSSSFSAAPSQEVIDVEEKHAVTEERSSSRASSCCASSASPPAARTSVDLTEEKKDNDDSSSPSAPLSSSSSSSASAAASHPSSAPSSSSAAPVSFSPLESQVLELATTLIARWAKQAEKDFNLEHVSGTLDKAPLIPSEYSSIDARVNTYKKLYKVLTLSDMSVAMPQARGAAAPSVWSDKPAAVLASAIEHALWAQQHSAHQRTQLQAKIRSGKTELLSAQPTAAQQEEDTTRLISVPPSYPWTARNLIAALQQPATLKRMRQFVLDQPTTQQIAERDECIQRLLRGM